jgi:hypothetical protein
VISPLPFVSFCPPPLLQCIFRDALFTQYRSSTKSKLARRKQTIHQVQQMAAASGAMCTSAGTLRNNSGNPMVRNLVPASMATLVPPDDMSMSRSSHAAVYGMDTSICGGTMMMGGQQSFTSSSYGNAMSSPWPASNNYNNCSFDGAAGQRDVTSDYCSLLGKYLDQQPPQQLMVGYGMPICNGDSAVDTDVDCVIPMNGYNMMSTNGCGPMMSSSQHQQSMFSNRGMMVGFQGGHSQFPPMSSTWTGNTTAMDVSQEPNHSLSISTTSSSPSGKTTEQRRVSAMEGWDGPRELVFSSANNCSTGLPSKQPSTKVDKVERSAPEGRDVRDKIDDDTVSLPDHLESIFDE